MLPASSSRGAVRALRTGSFVSVSLVLFLALLLVASITRPASATPDRQKNCTNCHGSGSVAGTVTATPSTATPAPSASYNVTITISANPNGGDTGYWIANSDAAGTTGTSVKFGGQVGTSQPQYVVAMTAPAAAGTYYYKVWANQGLDDASAQTNWALYSITVSSAPATPALASVAPTHALVGASVVLTGTNLGTAGVVSFGGTTAVTTAWSATSITATVPVRATGATTLSVTPTGSSASNAIAFTIDAPPVVAALTSVAPTHALVGASVVLTGTNLGTAGTVSFGGTTAVTTAWSATSITATVPVRATGATTVSVTPTGSSTSNAIAFTIDAAPALTSVAPTHALVGASVVLTGTNLGTAGVVSFGGTTAVTTAWSATSITATVPSMAVGATTVSVTPTGSSASNAIAFSIDAAPALTSVAPTHALVGDSVVLTGTNLGTAGVVSFGGTTAVTTAWSATSITATVPVRATGATTVSVTPTGSSASNAIAFTVDAPPVVAALTSVAPTHALVGASVVLTGTNLGTAGTVSFGGTTAVTTAWSATSITATVPVRATGATTVSVTPTGSSASNAIAFTVDAPPVVAALTSVAPTHALVGASVVLTGTNLGTAGVVSFGGTTAVTTAWSATSITATVPSMAVGATTVSVTPTGSSASNAIAFTVDAAPALTSVAPTHALVGDSVVLTGTNLGTAGVVSFGGTTAVTTAWSATSITATVPSMAVGATTVSVTPTGASTSNTLSFTVDAPPAVPVLVSVLPIHALVGDSVTLTGTNFGTAGTVSFGGTTAVTTAWSVNSITATVPSIAAGATSVSVTPTGGQSSNAVSFMVDAPPIVAVLASVLPAHALVGDSVILTGTDLGTAGTVSFGGTTAVTTAWSVNSITATVPTLAAGATTVSVTPTGGQSSNSVAFLVDAPVVVPPVTPALTSVAPTHARVGTAVVLSGANLGTGGTVRFGGTAAVATAWSATSITVKVPVRPIGATTVSVTPTGSSASNAIAFTVDATPVVKPLKAVVKAIAPLRGRVGAKVTITGLNFGKPGWVKFGTLKAKVVSWSAKKIVVKVPSRRPGAVMVTVTPLRAAVSNAKKFTVIK